MAFINIMICINLGKASLQTPFLIGEIKLIKHR